MIGQDNKEIETVTLTLSLTLSTHAGSRNRNSQPLTCGSSMWTEGQTRSARSIQ